MSPCAPDTLNHDTTQEDTQSLGGAAPALYAAGVAGLELLPLFAPQPFKSIFGVLSGVTRLRLWVSLLAGLLFGPFQVSCWNPDDVVCLVLSTALQQASCPSASCPSAQCAPWCGGSCICACHLHDTEYKQMLQ